MPKSYIPIIAILCCIAASAHAYLPVNLPGNTQYSGWSGLTSANNPGFPGFGSGAAWPAPILPNLNGSATNPRLNKVSGPGNPAGGSIYTFAAPTTFSLTSTNPLANLETLVFQIDLGNGEGGIFLNALPVLDLNGGTQNLAATYSATTSGAYAFIDFTTGLPGLTTILAYQWDVSAFADPITSYDIRWSAHTHSQIYALRLDSGDTAVQVIPEPASSLLLVLGGTLLLRRKRSRCDASNTQS